MLSRDHLIASIRDLRSLKSWSVLPEDILRSETAYWASPDGRYLAYLQLNCSAMPLYRMRHYGQSGHYGASEHHGDTGHYDDTSHYGYSGKYRHTSHNGDTGHFGYPGYNGDTGYYGYTGHYTDPGHYGYSGHYGDTGHYKDTVNHVDTQEKYSDMDIPYAKAS